MTVAAPAEARAVLRARGDSESFADTPWRIIPMGDAADRLDLLITGVGKANAAGATAWALASRNHSAVVNLGIAGSLPGEDGTPRLPLGAAALADASIFADEGLFSDEGFVDVASMGFPPLPGEGGCSVPADPTLLAALRPLADAVGPVATVSTCAGADALAAEVARRTGALAEAMEGAACALAAARAGAPFVELRVISNTTGSRRRQRWDMRGALDRLHDIAAAI